MVISVYFSILFVPEVRQRGWGVEFFGLAIFENFGFCLGFVAPELHYTAAYYNGAKSATRILRKRSIWANLGPSITTIRQNALRRPFRHNARPINSYLALKNGFFGQY